jgi:hypothetical protein
MDQSSEVGIATEILSAAHSGESALPWAFLDADPEDFVRCARSLS